MTKRILALILAVAVTLAAIGCSPRSSVLSFTEGSYTGTAEGRNGTITVEVTVSSDEILSVEVVDHSETAEVSDPAISNIPAEIVDNQSLAVDTVSGATMTSEAIISAVEAALVDAGGDVADLYGQSSDSSNASLTPGIYEATAQGFMGEVTVHVTVDETSIVSVDVVECTDRPDVITELPIKQIPAQIMENQSTSIDVVSGATFTSSAIINATKDALEQAGNASKFSTAMEKPEIAEGEDVAVDVLVIGGGGAGVISALSAKYADLNAEDSGLEVMLLEKQGFLGGSIILSGGSAMTTAPIGDLTNVNDETKMNQVYEYLQGYNKGWEVNRPLVENMFRTGFDTMSKLQQLGLSVVTAGMDGDPDNYERVFQRTTPYRNKVETFVETSDEWFWRGVEYAEFFEERMDHAGIDVRLNTAATELILEDGEVVGAKVTGPDSTYSVYAKKVILACGGIVQNPELIAKYAPDDVGVIPFANGGSDGDGFIMAEAVNANVVGNSMIGYLGTDFRYAMWSDLSVAFHRNGNAGMVVNTEGNRFIADSKQYNLYAVYDAIKQQPEKKAYVIIDANNPIYERVEASTQEDFKWKADSIEELAEMIDVPAENLVGTVESYNATYHAGEDDETFGVANENMVPVEQGPYYAVALNPVAIGSLVGLEVTENCEVVNVDGDVVPNLYAVGEMSFGGNFVTIYIGAWGNGYAINSGRIAGEHVKAAISN